MEAYLDNAATTKVNGNVVDTMAEALKSTYGNPNSLHKVGRDAEDKLESARKIIGESINADAEEIVFTSCATEGNNHIIKAFVKEGAHFITSKIEHPSVLRTMEYAEKNGVRVDYLSVDEDGKIDLSELKGKITKNTALVSIMMVNNETGVINDPEAIGRIVHEAGGKVKYHVDAVQGYMKYPIDVRKMNIDFLSVSAHKVHGPKGVGFVYMKKGQRPIPFFLGGGQERGLRAGTVNVPSILGFSEVPALLQGKMDENYKKVTLLKKAMIEELLSIKELKINSKPDCTSPYILNISLPGLRGEVMLHYLSDKGVYVSTGSACSSKDTKDSHVLQAIGVKEKEIKGSLRLSFSEENTLEEITYAAGVIKEAVNFLRRK